LENTELSRPNLIVVTGPTASGKTAFAAQLAALLDTEIISADSRQVYRHMDIGTGKDYGDYEVDGKRVACHLIDICEPGEQYNVYQFQQDFSRIYALLQRAGKVPVLAGGTGMYIEAVLRGYELSEVPADRDFRASVREKSQEELIDMLLSINRKLHNSTDLLNRKRTIRALEIARHMVNHPASAVHLPAIFPVVIGIKYDRESRRKRISLRLQQRLDEGLVEEVKSLIQRIGPDALLYYGLEYKYLTRYLIGELNYSEMHTGLETAIHQFAKRQMTWFRKMERSGIAIHWLDGHATPDQKLERTRAIFKKYNITL
jgi:tRNA dimethylallyltransferase